MTGDRLLLEQEDRAVTEALRFAGLRFGSVYDLVNSKQSYPEAIPILARLLCEVRHDRVKEGIARALSVKEARPVVDVLIDEFRLLSPESKSGEHTKWAIGNAISIAASDESLDDVVALLRDKRHGWTRSMLPLALANAKQRRQEAIRALEDLLADDEVAAQAATALGKLKAVEAIARLEQLASHHVPEIRKAATAAVSRLRRRQDRART